MIIYYFYIKKYIYHLHKKTYFLFKLFPSFFKYGFYIRKFYKSYDYEKF